MNVFLGIVSKAEKIGPELIEGIQSLASRCLPFREMPYRSQVWQSQSGKAALLAWDNEPAGDAPAPLIHIEGPYALTVSGYVFEPDIKGLGELMRRLDPAGDPRGRVADLGGTFVIACADGGSDTIRAWNTIIPIQSAYWAETARYTILGTRGLLVHLIAQESNVPRYNLPAMVPLLTYGYFANNMTPYEGVEILPMNSEVTVSAAGVKVCSIDGAEERIGQGDTEPDEAFYDNLTDVFLTGLRYVKDRSNKLVLGLSGGKDSRLLASGLKTIGANVTARSGGPPGHPDVILGKRIAEVLDIPHEHTQPIPDEVMERKEIVVDLLPRAIDVLFMTDAQANNWINCPRSDCFDPAGQVVGQGGEFYRGGYLKDAANRHGLDGQKMNALIEDKYMRFAEYINDELMPRYRRHIADWVSSQDPGMHPADVLEKLFAVTYGWRWAPPRFAASYSQRHRFYPLCDNKLLRLNYKVPGSCRLNDQFGYSLLKRLAPELIDVPFHKWRWWFEEDGPRDGDRKGWRRRAPLVSDKLSQVAVKWQHEVGVDLRGEFHEQIFRNKKAEGLFGIVKRDALERLFNSMDLLNTRSARFMWHVYTASVMLSNDWLLPVSPSRPATVRCDVAWHRVNRKIASALPVRHRAVRREAERRLGKWLQNVGRSVNHALGKLRPGSKADPEKALRPIRRQLEKLSERTARNYLKKLVASLEKIRAMHHIPSGRWSQHLETISLSGDDGQGGASGVSLQRLVDLPYGNLDIPSRRAGPLAPEMEKQVRAIVAAEENDAAAREQVMDYLRSLSDSLLADTESGILAGACGVEQGIMEALHVTATSGLAVLDDEGRDEADQTEGA